MDTPWVPIALLVKIHALPPDRRKMAGAAIDGVMAAPPNSIDAVRAKQVLLDALYGTDTAWDINDNIAEEPLAQ